MRNNIIKSDSMKSLPFKVWDVLYLKKSSHIKTILVQFDINCSIISRGLSPTQHLHGDHEKLSTEKQKAPSLPCLAAPDVCCSVSGKSGLRVNFLAVICRRAATTSCCRLEHENHYFNPSLPDINRMNKCFCSLLNLDEFIQMAMKTSKYPSQLPSW